MNVVGKVGSLITQGVNSVATPFHPFGGAIDIIVVEQQDGTYRSTPWYVRFGKFQGVLRGAEKIVRISVNGVEADFHMLLDNSGEAYFLREVVPGTEGTQSNGQVSNDFGSFRTCQGDDVGNIDDGHQNVYDESNEELDDNRQAHGSQDDRSSLGSPSGSPGYMTYNYESFNEPDNLVKSSKDSNTEMVLMSVDGHVITAPISAEEKNTDSVQLSTPQFHLGPGEDSGVVETNVDVWTSNLSCDLDSSVDKDIITATEDLKRVLISESQANSMGYVDIDRSVENTSAGISKDHIVFKSCLDLTASIGGDDLQDAYSPAIELEKEEKIRCSEDTTSSDIILEETAANIDHNLKHCAFIPLPSSDIPCSADMQAVDIDKDYGNDVSDNSETKDVQLYGHACLPDSDLHCSCGSLAMNIVPKDSDKMALDIENTNDSIVVTVHPLSNETEQKDAQVGYNRGPGRSTTEVECNRPDISVMQRISRFGFEISLCGNLFHPGMGRASAEEAFEAHWISEDEFRASGPEIIKDGNLIVKYKDEYFLWDKVAHIIVGMALFGLNFSVVPTDSIPVEHVEIAKNREETQRFSASASGRRWSLWSIPFQRIKSLQHQNSDCSSDELFVDSESCFESTCEEQTQSSSNNLSSQRPLLRTNIPTTEQIASLNLKYGQNTIAFSFTTRVLGKQQVDAHIYLWKCNAKIVISDVDGTITRSDVLGQFMPLVGKDWTQSGVAHLFSAIKENGYQLLFLSARAIVQAYLTKSFLFNLKQDGKALPTGPVVISPNGLIPSLYREVIRRAPHEFKIACLEDIRALFPSDDNPFYAGFGNRDTDELAYRKIGIPKGKIFIINPKGEVALYNCGDVKSYTSLHTLVNDMFPPVSLAEQEEYNSWNFWKVPLETID